MHFKTFNDFLHMGGYASYVWSAYGFALIILLINIISPVFQKKKLLQQLKSKRK